VVKEIQNGSRRKKAGAAVVKENQCSRIKTGTIKITAAKE